MKKSRVIFVVLPQVHLLDLSGPVQVFQEANDFGVQLQISFCAPEKDIVSSSGLPFGQLQSITSLEPSSQDIVVVAGANVNYLQSKEFLQLRVLFDWLSMAYEQGATICSICTGAFALGAAGLLDGRSCTTHWKRTAELHEAYPSAKVIDDQLFTEDNGILTSAGVASGIDLALYLVAQLSDDHTAFKIARELVLYIRRTGNEQQQSVFMKYRNHIHSGIHRVQDYVQSNLEKDTNLPVLSEIACMSSRSLTRTFKRATGITVNEYVTFIRKERLKELMKIPGYTRKQLAQFCGLKSERQVIRLINQT